jgi:hypothetical protein
MVIKEKSKEIITFGGWYQRTALHLTEVFNFLYSGESRLNLSKTKLKTLRTNLDIKSVERNSGFLESIKIITNSGIEIRYYEDGLYVLESTGENSRQVGNKIKKYFESNFEPALNYLFSIGAPTPKILSDIKEKHPIVIGRIERYPKRFKVDEKKYGNVYSATSSKDAAALKTKDYIFMITMMSKKKDLDLLTEMQIFFREFKAQLHKYLNIHREIWEDIAEIKEKKMIRGQDVEMYRAQLDSYQKTIQLIKNRINQMGSYAKTRASISKKLGVENNLVTLFQYKFEDLFNTLDYIKEVWNMTSDYVDSAIKIMNEIDVKSTSTGLKSIQLLASIGVVTGILRYMNPKYLPVFSTTTALYVIALGLVALALDLGIKKLQKRKRYELKFVERAKHFDK